MANFVLKLVKMKNKTTLIVLGVATLGIGAVVYYNWAWIEKNLMGKIPLSDSHGTVMGVIELDGVQQGTIQTDADNIEVEIGNGSNTYVEDDDGELTLDTTVVTVNNLVFPTFETDVQVASTNLAVQIHKVSPGMYQFVPMQIGDFAGIQTDLTVIDALSVGYKFGLQDSVGPYLLSEAPIASFPETGIYTIHVSFQIGSVEEGVQIGITMSFDMQVIL